MQGQLLKGMKKVTFPLEDTGRRMEAVIDHVQRLVGQTGAAFLVSVELSSRQPAFRILLVILESTCHLIVHNMMMPALHFVRSYLKAYSAFRRELFQ